MQIDDNTLAAARAFGINYAKLKDEHRTEGEADEMVALMSEACEAEDRVMVRQLGLWLAAILTPTLRSVEGALVDEAIERFSKQLGAAINEAVAEGRYERVEKPGNKVN